jgi:polyisoprenoid-binding protein YceI
MKNTIKTTTILFLITVISMSFNIVEEKKDIKTDESTVTWKGYKVTGSHHGTVNLQSGHLNFDGNTLTGGSFTIDMSTITCLDLSGSYKGKLEGHLKSDDFFGVETYSTATLTFTEVSSKGDKSYNVKGDLTIKNKTNPIEFIITVDGNKASTDLKIDRAKFDVRYGSPSFFNDLQDKAIYDEFDITANLVF